MSPDEITRLARLHLVVNDDWRIFGVEAFARAIEQAASRKAIEQCVEACREIESELMKDSPPQAIPTRKQAEGARLCIAVIRALLPDSKEQS